MPSGTARILVVDDSLDILSSLSQILSFYGHQVDTAFNGSEAFRKLDHAVYDLVVCDIEMPGITGLDFLQSLRGEPHYDLDVILMTGYLEQEHFVQALRLGAADFVSKPINAPMLVESIQNVMQKRHSRKSMAELYSKLASCELKLDLEPADFSKFSLSRAVSDFLSKHYSINPKDLNQILTCVDEMAYNAFIHGTLSLSREERSLSAARFEALVAERTTDSLVMQKRIRFSLKVSKLGNVITMSIHDDGEGFDHETWIRKIRSSTSENIQETGRGISLLYHFADELVFSNGGRTTTISKRIHAAL